MLACRYELWSFFGKELMTSPMFSHKSQSKFYCFMSFTRYHLPKDEDLPKTHSDILKHTKGHTALGELWSFWLITQTHGHLHSYIADRLPSSGIWSRTEFIWGKMKILRINQLITWSALGKSHFKRWNHRHWGSNVQTDEGTNSDIKII